jgi:hypothetical protein
MKTEVAGLLVCVAVVVVVCGRPLWAGPPPQLNDMSDVGTRYARGEQDIVSPEQREALGLDEPTWVKEHGKIHPEVYRQLEKAEEVKARSTKAKEAYLDPMGFAGTVYVQVQLKHERKGRADSPENMKAIKELESKVLSQLSAADFSFEYPLQTVPGIVGYASRAAIEALKGNADVAAICLDTKPFPRRPAHVTKQDLPPPQLGDPSTQPAHGRFLGSGGKVEADVYRALARNERVFVIINLNEPPSGDDFEGQLARSRETTTRVLSSVTAHEFWPEGYIMALLTGSINAEGLKKLQGHADIDSIGLDGPPIPPANDMIRRR